MTMTSMKMDAAEAKEYGGGAPSTSDMPAYPYGLCISLNDDAMRKLGMGLPTVGGKMLVTALVDVVSAGSEQTEGGGTKTRAELQITDMEVSPAPLALDAKKMFPNSGYKE